MRLAEARVRGLAGPPPPGTPLRPLAVDLNFGGELVKRMRCAGCGHSWTRTEGFSALSLQLPAAGGADPPTVQQLVEAHFAPAQIEVGSGCVGISKPHNPACVGSPIQAGASRAAGLAPSRVLHCAPHPAACVPDSQLRLPPPPPCRSRASGARARTPP
eukprot:scaffold8224_cov118-Isochrysis_galbana.AAC.1